MHDTKQQQKTLQVDGFDFIKHTNYLLKNNTANVSLMKLEPTPNYLVLYECDFHSAEKQ